MGSYANNLYVLLEVEESTTALNARTFNIELYEVRQDTGFINDIARMGSLHLQDKALDL